MDGNTSAIIASVGASKRRGFTLFEIVIVLALGIFIATTMAIVSIRFIQDRELAVVTKTMVSYLRTGYARAFQGENTISHGVSRADGKITLFRGVSYALRQTAQDTVLAYPDYIQFSGLSEVVFAQQTGLPSTTGSFVITDGHTTNTITVYSTGAISLE